MRPPISRGWTKFAGGVRAEALVVVAAGRTPGSATSSRRRSGSCTTLRVQARHAHGRRQRLRCRAPPSTRTCATPRAASSRGHRAYSIKLGAARRSPTAVRRSGRPDHALQGEDAVGEPPRARRGSGMPRFAELSIGEDAVIAAVAWLADPGGLLRGPRPRDLPASRLRAGAGGRPRRRPRAAMRS